MKNGAREKSSRSNCDGFFVSLPATFSVMARKVSFSFISSDRKICSLCCFPIKVYRTSGEKFPTSVWSPKKPNFRLNHELIRSVDISQGLSNYFSPPRIAVAGTLCVLIWTHPHGEKCCVNLIKKKLSTRKSFDLRKLLISCAITRLLAFLLSRWNGAKKLLSLGRTTVQLLQFRSLPPEIAQLLSVRSKSET